MALKFWVVIFIVVISQGATLKATDIYPDNLPDLFWPLRDHFYDRLAKSTATKPIFQSTICEFVRVCDYISPDAPGSIMRVNLRKDLEKYALKRGMTEVGQIAALGVLGELEAMGSSGSTDFYSMRPIPGYTHMPTADDKPIGIYPSDISSFFWVARDHFYEQVEDEKLSRGGLRQAFCEFISIGDHVASVPFMEYTLRNKFMAFAIQIAMKQERKIEILGILSELEAQNVYTVRPIPGYNPLKTAAKAAQDNLALNTLLEYFIKQQALAAEAKAKAFMGTAFSGLLSPAEISARLKVTIRGQDTAMDALGVIGHLIMAEIILKQKKPSRKFRAPHAFFAGPSGSGKSEAVKKLCEIIGIPWVLINAPGVVGEGFKGATLASHYRKLNPAGPPPPYAVVILDEAAKMCKKPGDDAPKYGASVMDILLPHLDGADVTLSAADGKEETISTRCFTYLATDACAHVPSSVVLTAETLSQHTGMPLELTNRFRQGIIRLVPHTVDSLLDILKNNPDGVYTHKRDMFKELYNADLVIEDGGLKAIAERSIADSTGARNLDKVIEQLLAPVYGLPPALIKEVDGARKIILTKEFVEKHLPPLAAKPHEAWRDMFI